ncbi:alpha/beta hydrolase [Dysgonomonas sp. 521]|nr:alpha/beta hydrolase [Dysgonomonas sp. 521]
MAQNVEIDGIARDTSFTVYSAYTKELKKRPYIEIAQPQLPENVKAIEHIPYSNPSPNRNLSLHIYRPDDECRYPALLMVHGGGWTSGSLSMQMPMAQQIASKGYVAIPVEYRLSPEVLYPAAVHDLKTAVRWVRANAEEYGIDTTKIAISGCSSGGHLAMLIGMTNSQPAYEGNGEYAKYQSNVHAVINIDGISDFSTDELNAARESLSKNKIPASIKWLGATYEEDKNKWEEASPVNHITEYSAPVCFINSSIPRFHGGRDEAIRKLSTYNIHTEVHTIDDTPHPFWLFHPWFGITVNYTVGFLDKVLKMKKM